MKQLKRLCAFVLVLVMGVLLFEQAMVRDVQAATKAPGKAVIRTITATSAKSVKLSWKKLKYATKYEVHRATAKKGPYKLVKTTTATSMKDKGLRVGGKYYYRVRGVNDTAKGAFSAKKYVKTKLTYKGLWKEIPNDFTFTSGVGGWATCITIKDDGSFKGEYHDSEMGDYGPKYPNGVVYLCNFSGKFSTPKKVGAYTYKVTLKSLTLKQEPVKYEDGFKYIYSGPYGIEGGKTFYIYLPGKCLTKKDEAFRSWVWDLMDAKKMPKGAYGLYNVKTQEGFAGFSDEYESEYYY